MIAIADRTIELTHSGERRAFGEFSDSLCYCDGTGVFGSWLCSRGLRRYFDVPYGTKKLWVTASTKRPNRSYLTCTFDRHEWVLYIHDRREVQRVEILPNFAHWLDDAGFGVDGSTFYLSVEYL